MEYNLSNPSVSEEERMIHDCIDAEYKERDMENENYWKSIEEDYYKSIEEDYWKSIEEDYWKSIEEQVSKLA